MVLADQVYKFGNSGDLFHHIARSACFDENTTRFYAAEILEALIYLHKNNIIYRDLQPENVLLDQEGHIKLADFGLAKKLDSKKEV